MRLHENVYKIQRIVARDTVVQIETESIIVHSDDGNGDDDNGNGNGNGNSNTTVPK